MPSSEQLSNAASGVNLVTDTTWGDGGKGKIAEMLAQKAHVVVRPTGGPNAGHTIVNERGEFKLHVIPSGIFNRDALSVVAGGVVVNPLLLVDEISSLQARGVEIDPSNLLISDQAQLIMLWHRKRDGLNETARGGEKIGTTGQGIGPTYADRRERTGLRVKDLLTDDNEFDAALLREAIWQDRLLRTMNHEKFAADASLKELVSLSFTQLLNLARGIQRNPAMHSFNFDEMREQLLHAREILAPYVGNALLPIWKAHEEGKNILGEGAQGALLDLDLGGYPYVTSSNPGLAGFITSTGLQGNDVDGVYGVTKAFATRVGEGPMPTELHGEEGEYIRKIGNEYGATTGRPRRVGWFDAVAVRYGAKISGATSMALTKVDILDTFESLQICVGYQVNGTFQERITDPQMLRYAVPVYETMPGWKTSTTGARTYEELPENAKNYIRRIEQLTRLKVKFVSVGAHRDATIIR